MSTAKSPIAEATEALAKAAASSAAASPRKEAPGILKRSSSFYADPATIGTREGWNPRFDFGEIEELAKSIKHQKANGVTGGLLNSLRVKRVSGRADGKLFEIVDGGRRLLGVEHLLKHGEVFEEGVPITLVDKAQDDVTSLIQMFEANTGLAFNPLEEAAAFKRMKDAGMTLKQICAAVQRAQPHVTSMLALLDADASVLEALKDGSITKTDAKNISANAKGDKEAQKALVGAAKDSKKGGKAAKADLAKKLHDKRAERAKTKGKVIKMRALSDIELSKLGASMAESVVAKLKEAGKPANFDVRAWAAKDEKLALVYAAGALAALKAAAGVKIELDI